MARTQPPLETRRVQAQDVLGEHVRCETLTVVTPDGLKIAVQDWGLNCVQPAAEILFIHGFSQSHQAFLRQAASALSRRFRIVTFDLRGHGDSDKPDAAQFYRDPIRWAGEVRSVMEQTGLTRPVLVPWSYGGRVALDYLTEYGDTDLAGLVMVNATAKASPGVLGPGVGFLKQMTSSDEKEAIEATRSLLNCCFSKPVSAAELEYMLAYNRKVPPPIRVHLAGRPAEYAATLRAIRVPTLIIHGEHDPINARAMALYTARHIPHAQLRFYPDAAHMPFWESADQFNLDLDQFVTALSQSFPSRG